MNLFRKMSARNGATREFQAQSKVNFGCSPTLKYEIAQMRRERMKAEIVMEEMVHSRVPNLTLIGCEWGYKSSRKSNHIWCFSISRDDDRLLAMSPQVPCLSEAMTGHSTSVLVPWATNSKFSQICGIRRFDFRLARWSLAGKSTCTAFLFMGHCTIGKSKNKRKN